MMIALVLVSIVAATLLILALRWRVKASLQTGDSEQLQELREELRRTQIDYAEQSGAANSRNEEIERLRSTLAQLQHDKEQLQKELTVSQTTLKQEQQQLHQLQETFRTEFKNLSNEILKQQGNEFTALNKQELQQLMKPFSDKLSEFKEQIEKNKNDEIKRTAELRTTIEQLSNQSAGLSKEAQQLSEALRGNNKTAGDYGEMLLRQVLESAGLTEGIHFVEQGKGLQLTGENNNRLKPDTIIMLPDDRHLIVDSKMSLKSYLDWSNAANKEEAAAAAAAFSQSIRAHIDGLKGKQYPQAFQSAQTPDMVLLFIPIEQAFLLAVHPHTSAAKPLHSYAWEKGIVLVSPTTLLATARTIAHIWQQNDISKNAHAIAERGGKLYNKFADFVSDLDKVSTALDKAQEAQKSALSKLSGGSGNLIRQVELLKELGATATKELPQSYRSQLD